MTAEIEFNARSVPPGEVARSFVPPEPHFSRLLARNHTLVLGPRGSGKTTLLKMLTLRALKKWKHRKAAEYSEQIVFNAAFVQADVAWGRQLEALDQLPFDVPKREAAFVIHTLRALIFAMREAVELGRADQPAHLAHLAVKLTEKLEEQFVLIVRESLEAEPLLNTLLGLELALEAKLNSINQGKATRAYSAETLPSLVSLLISAFNGLCGDDERRWALLFDELEIAPPAVQKFLLSSVRSFDERVIVKLAMAPYMEEVGFEHSPTAPQSLHDYSTVQLTYPHKGDAVDFSEELFRTALRRMGVEAASLPVLFADPDGPGGFGRKVNNSRRRTIIPEEFASLARKDDSFKQYVASKGLDSPSYKFSEDRIATDIRKVLPVAIARDYYIRKFESGRVSLNRSRKTYHLYTGYPSLVEITEGNPRAILTLIGPMVSEYRRMSGSKVEYIPAFLQAQAVQRVELLLTSLLQVIPLDLGGFAPAKGLLDFVDQIGRNLERRLLRRPFAPDYVGTFVLDENVTPAVISAVGKALNAGALIHVPARDGGPDSLLRGLARERFRISYALSARYRLLLTLGDKVNLSAILMENRGALAAELQSSLFDPEDHDDNF